MRVPPLVRTHTFAHLECSLVAELSLRVVLQGKVHVPQPEVRVRCSTPQLACGPVAGRSFPILLAAPLTAGLQTEDDIPSTASFGTIGVNAVDFRPAQQA